MKIITLFRWTTAVACLAAMATPSHAAKNWTDDEIKARLHAPITQDGEDTKPRPYVYAPPQPLALPTDETLTTITVKNRNFRITQVAKKSDVIKSKKNEDKDKLRAEGLAIYEADDEALFFKGTGGAGLKSKERLVVENCTFVLDFSKGNVAFWEPRRTAIYVDGYKEVVIRNCVFISMMKKSDPVRKVNSSINVEDCLKVQIENCYFEGLSNWMRGHITALACGPTAIRNCEIAGQRQGNSLVCGGGIWVASGIGETKLGTPIHADQPELMIYPAGPLLIENCWVHDQRGTLNTDGIYVQSIHPFVIRNTKVENWQEDSLIDVGFRDSARGKYNGKNLVNHGAVGVIENCEFGEGYLKDSVGAGGGIIFRDNLVKNAWIFPYIFDGGSWFVVNNRFTDMTGVLLSGYNDQTRGWVPPEGMLIGGSKFYFYGNDFAWRAGAQPPAIFVSSPVPVSTLKDNIVSDYNRYDAKPLLWADDRAAKTAYSSLEEWRAATGNDKNSVVGPGGSTLDGKKIKLPAGVLPGGVLPGGVAMRDAKIGLTGAVGPDAGVLGAAQTLAAKVKQEMKAAQDAADAAKGIPAAIEGTYEFEDLRVVGKSGGVWMHPNTDTSNGQYVLWQSEKAGDFLTLDAPVFKAGAYDMKIYFFNQTGAGRLQLQVDGKDVGAPAAIAPGGATFGGLRLDAGNHEFTLKLIEPDQSGKTIVRLDRFDLTSAR